MSNKQFFNNLSATYADVRKLDVKKINLKGKNILEYIKESIPTIKHSQDTRETITENDLWGQWIETKDDGTIIVHDDEVTNPNGSSVWNSSITKLEDTKAYVGGESGDTFFANIQTKKLKVGSYMFNGCSNLTSIFFSDFSSLTHGDFMFQNCANLTLFYTTIHSLKYGQSMFKGCSNLATFHTSISLSNLTNGASMFQNCISLTSFSSDLSSLTNGQSMFKGCSQLNTFSSDLPSLTDGNGMFDGTNLSEFTSDLSSLMTGWGMFDGCSQLTTFSSDLSNLSNGREMFSNCSQLNTFSSDLPSLTDGNAMFFKTNLTSFSSDLSNLIRGMDMFAGCTNLTSFSSVLSSLTNGVEMFSNCKLDAESVMFIADSIKDIAAEKQLYINGTIPYVTYDSTAQKYSAPIGFMEDGSYVYTYNNPNPITIAFNSSDVARLALGINVSNNTDTIQQQLEDFAKEATYDSWKELKQEFVDKGWTVTFQYGGSSIKIPNTYDLRNGEQIIPCPIFAKLVQVEDKDYAQYCTEDASSFYNIEWGHDVTDTSSYTQFDSLEDAMASWNVFPKENIITTEE